MNIGIFARWALAIFPALVLVYFGLTAAAMLFNAHNLFATLLLMLLGAVVITALVVLARTGKNHE